jgi:serine/threonine protein kinase
VHRDVKLDNLLYTSKDPNYAIVKLSDFGFARFLVEGALATTTCGTPTYVAPEILC